MFRGTYKIYLHIIKLSIISASSLLKILAKTKCAEFGCFVGHFGLLSEDM